MLKCLKVFINPEIKVTGVNKVKFPEACESIKGYSATVPRFHSVKLIGLFYEIGAKNPNNLMLIHYIFKVLTKMPNL
jgi:peptide deformylase